MAYYVIGADGMRYGPGDMDQLQEWVREGRVKPDSIIEDEDTGTRTPASEMAGLDLTAAEAPTQPEPEAAEKTPVQPEPQAAAETTKPEQPAAPAYAPGTYPAPARGSAAPIFATIIVLAIIAVAVFVIITKLATPTVVGNWKGDIADEIRRSTGAPANALKNATATAAFDRDKKFTLTIAVTASNPFSPQQPMKVETTAAGDYTADGKKGTMHIKSVTSRAGGQTQSTKQEAEAVYELRDRSTLVISPDKNNPNVKLTLKRQ